MNALTKCPLIIVFNILMMVAVKTKPQLRTKSNIALACLSTTDLAVGLVLQPLDIACASSLLNSDIMFCTITDLFEIVTSICILASFHHSFGFDERRALYWVKHSFVYEIQVTEVRIIMASALVWATAIILFSEGFSPTAILIVCETLLIILPIYFSISVCKKVCRNKTKIAANQLSLEALKEKFLKKRNRKLFTRLLLYC